MTATVRPTRWAAQQARFNTPAAEVVYKAIMDCPDDESAAITARVILAGCVEHELLAKGYAMAAAADVIARGRADALSKRLATQALAKARRHEDAAGELAGMALLVKALDFSDEERARFARAQQRDLRSGRFVREHQPVAYDRSFKPLSDTHAKQLGIPAPPGHLSDKDRAHYQQAYQQLGRMIAPFVGLGDRALIHLHIADQNGAIRTDEMQMPNSVETANLGGHLQRGEHLHTVSVSAVPPTTAAGAYFDALAPLSPGAAGVAYEATERGALNAERLGEHRRGLGAEFEPGQQADFIPSRRVFRNLEQSSRLLSDSLGPAAPPKVKMALAVGEHVGRYGPEAQKVIGPTADKAAYRYRGTERALPADLSNSIAQIGQLDVGDKRWYMLHGNAKPDGSVPATGWRPSMVLDRFRALLPSADLSTLHLKSGAVPPSRGVVFDKDGKASVLAVGYGDDHYLPFNLRGRSFRALKGGEYIRTRTFGGPTTEDIYGSLMSGAHGFAVVSHSGVFSVDYAPDLKGGKRFNDSAARMVARYGYLLDAVRSEQVTTGGIAPSRRAEITAAAEARYPEATHKVRHDEEVKRLTTYEQAHPTLSSQQRQRATLEFFNNQASMGRGAGDLRQSMVADYVRDEGTARWEADKSRVAELQRRYPAAHAETPGSLEFFQSQVRDELTGLKADQIGARYADILGLRPALDAHLAAAAKENAERLKPLRLNGEGYNKALQALQEEFPHYIADVQFHPWSDATGRLDTGYVRPRHARPAEALAGYFDRGRNLGSGKVYADTTRWQNRRRVPVAVEKPAQAGTTAAAGAASVATPDAGTTAAMRRDADKALFHAYAGATTVGSATAPGALGITDPNQLRNLSVATLAEGPEAQKALGAAVPNLNQLFKLQPDQFEAMYAENPDRVHTMLAGAKAENDRLHLIDVPAGVEESFTRGGRPAAKKTLGEHPHQALDNPRAEFDFGAEVPAYDASMRPTTAQVEAEYGTEPTVQALVADKTLPESVGSPEFPDAAKRVLDALTARRANVLSRARREGIIPSAEDLEPLDRPAEGVVRALQLRRRHDVAAEREREAGALTPGPVGDEPFSRVENSVVMQPPRREEWMSDEDWDKTLASFNQAWLEASARMNPQDPNAGHRVIEP